MGQHWSTPQMLGLLASAETTMAVEQLAQLRRCLIESEFTIPAAASIVIIIEGER